MLPCIEERSRDCNPKTLYCSETGRPPNSLQVSTLSARNTGNVVETRLYEAYICFYIIVRSEPCRMKPADAILLIIACAVLAAAPCQARQLNFASSTRKLTQATCAEARTNCYNNICSANGVSVFDCTDAGIFTDGSWTCTCNTALQAAASCFSGASTVALKSGATKSMAELELGDEVLAVTKDGALTYSPIFMFTSRRPGETTTFVHIATSAGANITVTPSHYLFARKACDFGRSAGAYVSNVHDWPYLLPRDIQVGDAVPVRSGDKVLVAKVTSVSLVADTGVYMPHTATGAIVVDGVAVTEMTDAVPAWLAGHKAHSAGMALIRAFCRVMPSSMDSKVAGFLSQMMHGLPDATADRSSLLSN